MASDSQRHSVSQYNQGTDEKTVATKKGTAATIRQSKSVNERALESVSVVSRTSGQKANIAFQIDFTVKLRGRYPLPK